MIRYIDNNINYGIQYDFKKIEKEVDKLGLIPKGLYNPLKVHEVSSGRQFVDLSERSIGKTTAWLLIGMVGRKLYDNRPQIIYIRQVVDMILPKSTSQLFDTIKAHDYISKITDGRYNDVIYKSRSFYYYNRDTFEIDDTAFMVMLSVDEWHIKKSSFNAPFGDFIYFDEFIGKTSPQDEFAHFYDLVKTVIRERDSALIVFLGNTINKQHIYFRELEILNLIQSMKIGERRVVTTDAGTTLDVALIGSDANTIPPHRVAHNRKFFGFKNPQLNSIRGGEWAGKLYPHCPKLENPRTLIRNRYIRHNGFLLNLELMQANELGLFVKVHLAKDLHDDSIVYHIDTSINNNREYFRWGRSKVDLLLKDLLSVNKWYYATNTEGSLIDDYIKCIRQYDRFN